MGRSHLRVCRHCREWFAPDHRHVEDQWFCAKPECRKASHRHSQHKWLCKYPDFYRGNEHIHRVQAWRQEHPDYAKNPRPARTLTIKLHMTAGEGHSVQIHARCHDFLAGALQDSILTQHPKCKRFAMMVGGALHDPMGFRFLKHYRLSCFKSGLRSGSS